MGLVPSAARAAATVILLSQALAAQSLADVARKTEKPAAKAPVKGYTNKDAEALPPAIVTQSAKPADTPKPPEASATSSPSTSPAIKKDEAYWKDRMRPLDRILNEARTVAAAAASRFRKVTADYDTARTLGQQSLVERPFQDAEADHKKALAALANAERAVADLEEEARRENVLPGWLRLP